MTPTLTTLPHLRCACGTQKCSIILALCSNGCSFYYVQNFTGFCQGLVGGSLVIRLSKSVCRGSAWNQPCTHAHASFTQGLAKPYSVRASSVSNEKYGLSGRGGKLSGEGGVKSRAPHLSMELCTMQPMLQKCAKSPTFEIWQHLQ